MTAQPPDLDIDARPIPGWPGYLATADGQILGRGDRPLRPRSRRRTGGHLRVRLYGPAAPRRAEMVAGGIRSSGRWCDVYVHVAVALAWHGPPPAEDSMVLHWNDDPTNNAPENLRWGSATENWADRRRNADSRDDDGFDWATGEEEAA
jgi:hypothetical protein